MLNACYHAKPPKYNIWGLELKAFKNLVRKNEVIITKEDKGNVIVILNKSDYLAKMLDLLADANSYKILSRNPCSKILKKVKLAVSSSSFD